TGNPLYVSHYLLINGIIDLNGESQLLQPHGSIVDGASTGHLDRDQQGTQSSYNYNYWVSPVGPGASNAAYSVGGVMMDGSTPETPQDLDFGPTYYYADADYTGRKKISEYWLHKFHGTANDYFTWDHIGSTGTMNAGEGFSMKGTMGSAAILDAQNYTFRGLPNNGDITPGVTGNPENYLIGNPYPSAIDAIKFIEDNLTLAGPKNVFNGTIYFWSHFADKTHYLEEYVGGYAAFNISGGVRAVAIDERINATTEEGGQVPKQYIPVGQAFFINTVVDSSLDPDIQDDDLPTSAQISGGPVIFKNSQRVFEKEATSRSVFHSQEKKGAATATTNNSSSQEVEQNKIWLKFKSPKGYHRQILVTADQRATENFDLGFDAPMIDENVEDMYWYFNKYQFVIQGVPDFNIERVLDLGINVEQKGALSISIDDLDNIPDEMNIYLADSLNQVVHDLRAEPYETESEAGTFTDRFKLVFQDKTQIEEPEVPIIEEGPFEVLYVTGTRNVLLRNPELLEVDRVYLNNMLGQQVHVYYNVPSEKEVELPVKRFAAGVYIVKVHYEGGIVTRKVILE
ncbi:MAG: T9SS type A sorting domain-containing protein, partial [Salinimicrobium sediminis]|nr:T9SS type A sorting domain-containing protein [Salinimicrobium sediminis]